MSIAPERGGHPPAACAPGARRARRTRRHDEAVIHAEVRRLARALRPYGVLHREVLERTVAASRWREGGFDGALDAAVRRGIVERLPADFYRIAASDADRAARAESDQARARHVWLRTTEAALGSNANDLGRQQAPGARAAGGDRGSRDRGFHRWLWKQQVQLQCVFRASTDSIDNCAVPDKRGVKFFWGQGGADLDQKRRRPRPRAGQL